MSTPHIITAVIVLYGRSAAESEAFVSLQRILTQAPRLRASFRIVLYDNSTESHVPSEDSVLDLLYRHDPSNGGLAPAYNYAFMQAQVNQSEWLLLLDQDTTLTEEYVVDLLAKTTEYAGSANICAVVPILELNGRVYSPEADFFYHLRHQFPHSRYYPVARDTHGVQAKALSAYNSGAAIRVSALRQIGGFPADFRIDFLDHAVFQAFHRLGFSLYVLSTVLQQKLALLDLNAVSLLRHTSVLQSQTLFVARYGTWLDRLLYRLWLLRKSREYRAICHDPRVWKAMVWQALGKWRFPSEEQLP